MARDRDRELELAMSTSCSFYKGTSIFEGAMLILQQVEDFNKKHNIDPETGIQRTGE